MTEQHLPLTSSEVTEYLRRAFAPRQVVVRLVDHGADVELEFLAFDGSTAQKLDPVPLDQVSTVAALDILISQIKHHLDEA